MLKYAVSLSPDEGYKPSGNTAVTPISPYLPSTEDHPSLKPVPYPRVYVERHLVRLSANAMLNALLGDAPQNTVPKCRPYLLNSAQHAVLKSITL